MMKAIITIIIQSLKLAQPSMESDITSYNAIFQFNPLASLHRNSSPASVASSRSQAFIRSVSEQQ